MYDCEKINETSLPGKADFYSHLNMEDIADADYTDAKRVCKDFEIKNLGEYHDLFKVICYCQLVHLRTLEKFLSAPGLLLQAALKKTKLQSDLLTNIDVLLMVEKCIVGGIVYSIYRYVKANDKYMKDYDINKESSYIQYWEVNNYYGLLL